MTKQLEALIARILKLASLAEQTNINESSESWVAYLNEVSPANVRELIAALELKEEQRATWFNVSSKLGDELDAAEKRIAELEASETQLICERDNAEEALADMYQAATGERPEWSNFFSFSDAVDAVEQRLGELEASPLAVKLPDRKDIRFWPGDAFEFDTLGYVMAVEEAIRAAGGKVEGE